MSDKNGDLFSQFEKLYWSLSKEMSYIWKGIFERRFPGAQSHILFLLEKNGRKKMSEIAELLHLTPGAVTIASDKLIDQGYVVRIRDEKDRRVVYMEMTNSGQEVITDLKSEGRKVMKTVFSHLNDEDMSSLIGIFEKASKNIYDLRKENME